MHLHGMRKIINRHNIFLGVGFILLLWYVWIRLLRERLPQDIPFDLSFYTLIILLFICLRYIYIIYKIIRPQQNSLWMHMFKDIIKYAKIPLVILDDYLRTNKYTNSVLYFLCYNLLKVLDLNPSYKRSLFIYLSYMIIPKVIWLLCLIIDCIYYKQLKLTYLYSMVMIVPLFTYYTLYYIKISAVEHLILLNKWFLIEITSKDIIYKPEDYDEEGFLKHHLPKHYTDPSEIEYDDHSSQYNDKGYCYLVPSKFIDLQSGAIYWQYESYTYNILYEYERKDYVLLGRKITPCPMTKNECNDLLYFYTKGDALDKHIQTSMKHYVKETNIIVITVNILFFLCWTYILLISLPNVPWDNVSLMISYVKPYEIFSEFSVFPWYIYPLDIHYDKFKL